MKTSNFHPQNSTILSSVKATVKTITFGLLLGIVFSSVKLNAQNNIVLKEGLYYASSGALYSGTFNSYDQNNVKLASFTLVEGKKNGAVTYYYSNGNVKETGAYLNNEKTSQWLRWDEAGNKIAEAFYKEGKKDGTWMIWDMNGTKRYEMFYSMDKKVGKWSMWDEKGNLTSEKLYESI
jgi:YD repeat-containing protein